MSCHFKFTCAFNYKAEKFLCMQGLPWALGDPEQAWTQASPHLWTAVWPAVVRNSKRDTQWEMRCMKQAVFLFEGDTRFCMIHVEGNSDRFFDTRVLTWQPAALTCSRQFWQASRINCSGCTSSPTFSFTLHAAFWKNWDRGRRGLPAG